jgi:hypothetical protein
MSFLTIRELFCFQGLAQAFIGASSISLNMRRLPPTLARFFLHAKRKRFRKKVVANDPRIGIMLCADNSQKRSAFRERCAWGNISNLTAKLAGYN